MYFVKQHPSIQIPERATEGSSGYDLRAYLPDGPVRLPSGVWKAIPTGISIQIGLGWEGQVRSRSGLAVKHGVSVLNSPGTIDSDYRGEIKVILINHGPQVFIVENEMRIAQLVFSGVSEALFYEQASLGNTVRGAGGFGHTGV